MFEQRVLSYEIKAAKPDPKFYEFAAIRADVPAERIMFVDDLATNVEGARKFGMDAVQFRSTSQLVDDLTRRGVHTNY